MIEDHSGSAGHRFPPAAFQAVPRLLLLVLGLPCFLPEPRDASPDLPDVLLARCPSKTIISGVLATPLTRPGR